VLLLDICLQLRLGKFFWAGINMMLVCRRLVNSILTLLDIMLLLLATAAWCLWRRIPTTAWPPLLGCGSRCSSTTSGAASIRCMWSLLTWSCWTSWDSRTQLLRWTQLWASNALIVLRTSSSTCTTAKITNTQNRIVSSNLNYDKLIQRMKNHIHACNRQLYHHQW